MNVATLSYLILILGFANPTEPVFEQGIRQIFKAHCFECHGEGEKLKGGLDLRLKRLILKGGETGPSLVEAKPEQSLLIERVSKLEMPPGKRKLKPEEIDLLKLWIKNGAKTSAPEPEIIAKGFFITDDEKKHWAFQKIISPAIPQVKNQSLVKNPIDAFILKKLEDNNLVQSKPADKTVLLRRIFLDLTGMPPTPEELTNFLQDTSKDAYEKQIDKLLLSKNYGERWGRHWLDVVGYADSEGYDGSDVLRSSSYHYRDYVIRSFNSGKPFDQFIIEQLAGDELVKQPYTSAATSDLDKLIATGFLRQAPDGSNQVADIKLSSHQTITDTIQIVSTALMGLTVQCAQCHNHRYDPISQVDYFKFRAVFEPALNWKEWKSIAARELKIQYPADKIKSDELEKKAITVDKKRQTRVAEIEKEEFEKSLLKAPSEKHTEIRKAFETPLAKRTTEQKKLLSDNPNSNVNAALIIQRNAKLAAEIKVFTDEALKIREEKPIIASYRILTEVPNKASTTYLQERGDFNQPKEEVKPGHLSLLGKLNLPSIPEDDPTIPTTGRRLAFARSLVSENHPLTSRVLVNRFWMHHFGKPLAGNPADFGKLGEVPTHPELLDWLANNFIKSGWNLKDFHKLVLTSNTYKQSSIRTEMLEKVDPDNKLLARMNVLRLEAESIRDSILKISSKLNDKLYGPPVPITPDDYGQIIIGADTRDGAGRFTNKKVNLKGEEFRRSIYVQVRRSTPLAVFESFDAPILSPNCEHRNFSTSSTQSLLMLNSQFILEYSEYLALKLKKEVGSDLAKQVSLAWKLVFCSAPTKLEMERSLNFIKEQSLEFSSSITKDQTTPDLKALTAFCQGLLISNRFLYID